MQEGFSYDTVTHTAMAARKAREEATARVEEEAAQAREATALAMIPHIQELIMRRAEKGKFNCGCGTPSKWEFNASAFAAWLQARPEFREFRVDATPTVVISWGHK